MNLYRYMEESGADGVADGGAAAESNQATEGGNWYDSLPQDMREDQNITKFESVESMAKSWQNAQRMIGKDKIPMPETDEDWANTYSRLGRPDEAAKYEITAPDGMEINPEMQQAFKETAHGMGLNQGQMQKLTEWYFGSVAAQQEASNSASEAALNEAMTGLKNEWGQAFDQNVGIAQRAISEFLTDSDKNFMNTAVIDGVKVGNHPVMAKLFHNIGKSMMEGGKLEGQGNEQAMTPSDMQDRIDSLMANPAYLDRKHPEHKQIARQVQQLFEQKYG